MNKIYESSSVNKPNYSFGNILLQTTRIIVGLLFIFSGLVKANDPSGLSYKMQEFFEVWQWHGISSYSLFLSITMIIFEIIAGVALILGYGFRLFSFLLLVLMLFFTYLTAYAVFSGKIKECGCFGDCIPLQAKQSFIKDLILLILVVILFIARKHIKPLFKRYVGTSIMILSLFASGIIQWYALEHLPFVDCLPYKKGNNIWQKTQTPENATPDVYQTTYELKNKITGETKTLLDDQYLSSGIWQDTSWEIQGEPVSKLIKKGENGPEIEGFMLTDFEGNDFTEYILTAKGYTFLWFVRDVKEANDRNIERIKTLIEKSEKEGINFYMLTSNNQELTDKFLIAHKIQVVAMMTDGTISKTAMRSNPGLILLKNGTVIDKWSYNNYPKDFVYIKDSEVLKLQK